MYQQYEEAIIIILALLPVFFLFVVFCTASDRMDTCKRAYCNCRYVFIRCPEPLYSEEVFRPEE